MKNTSPWAVRALSRLLVMVMAAWIGLAPAMPSFAQAVDPVALGLAAKALNNSSTPAGISAAGGALRTEAPRSASPWERPLFSGATVTSPATTPAELTRGYAPYVAIASNASGITNSATIIKDVFRGIGGTPKNYGNNLALKSTTAATGNIGGSDIQNGAAYEFMVDAAKVAARFFRQGSTLFRVAINGQYVSSGTQSFDTTYSGGVVVIDFGSRTTALVRIEVMGGTPLTAVWVGATESVWKPEDVQRPQVAVIGDSYTVRGSATFSHYTPAAIACSLNGWDCTAMALGGTGYIEPGVETPFSSRLPGLDEKVYDVVAVLGGINDKAYAASDITAAALSLYRGIRSRQPRAKIIVAGPWPGSSNSPNAEGVPVAIVTVEAAVKAAFDAFADPNSQWVPISSDVSGPWFWGSGYVGAPAGNGNNDLYSVADRTHINDAGSIYAGFRLGNAIRAARF